jgi:hypothetical protein
MKPTETYFQVLALSSHASLVGATHEGVTPCTLARLVGYVRAGLPMWRHVGFSHAKRSGATPSAVAPIHLVQLLCIIVHRPLFLPLFLSSSSSPLLVAAPLAILEFPPLLEACGASNQLHELVPQSCWVCTSSLPSHFVAL